MHDFSSTVAIATLSSRVLDNGRRSPLRAGVVAALSVTGDQRRLTFTPRVHIVRSPASLTHWVNDLIADDPLLVGYRLGHSSRLLQQAGYRPNLVASFSATGRHDVLDVVRGKPAALSVTATMHGVMAVDEDALLRAAPVNAELACNLALINAVASWVIYVGSKTPGKAGLSARRAALGQLGMALNQSPVHGLLAAALTGSIQ